MKKGVDRRAIVKAIVDGRHAVENYCEETGLSSTETAQGGDQP